MAYDEANELLKVQVQDSGCGIRAEDMIVLFKQFGKLKRTAKMNSEGIGMGLMICQNLVQKNGGTISVHSDGIDKGSIFTFTMCMQSQKEDSLEVLDEQVVSEDVGANEASLNYDTILVVPQTIESQLLGDRDNRAPPQYDLSIREISG